MPSSRRSFIKRSLTTASAGLLLPKLGWSMDDPYCTPRASWMTPDIRVLFSGLLLFRFRPGSAPGTEQCFVNPLKFQQDPNDPHFLSVVVKAREGNDPPYTLGRHLGIPESPLTLSVDGVVGVQKYTPNGPTFNRDSATNDCRDWRWTLRLGEFIGSGQRPEFPDLWTGMRITDGMFYTAMKTNRDRTRIFYTYDGQQEQEMRFYSIGSLVGADIQIPSNQTARLRGPNNATIEMPKRSNVTYEVYFEYDVRTPAVPQIGQRTRSHYHHYYYSVEPKPQGMPSEIRFERLAVTRNARANALEHGFGTPDVPCMGLEG